MNKRDFNRRGIVAPLLAGVVVGIIVVAVVGYFVFRESPPKIQPAGQPGDGSTVQPDGTVVKPDGTMVKPDGTMIKPDGTMVKSDGTIFKTDGTTIKPDGTIVKPDGTMVKPDGTMVQTDGKTVKKEDGAVMEKKETAPPPPPPQPPVVGDPGESKKYQGTILAGTFAPLIDFNKADYDKVIGSGKLVVLYFYADWCPICKAEFPKMQSAFSKLTTNDVVGFRVNYNDTFTDDVEKALAAQHGVAYQHTKVFVKGGQRILKSPEGWAETRYLSEINKAL